MSSGDLKVLISLPVVMETISTHQKKLEILSSISRVNFNNHAMFTNQMIWRLGMQIITVQTFPISTSELEDTGLVYFTSVDREQGRGTDMINSLIRGYTW